MFKNDKLSINLLTLYKNIFGNDIMEALQMKKLTMYVY